LNRKGVEVVDIFDYFYNNNGYARMKNLKEAGFHTRVIAKALRDGIIEKIKPGLYKLVDYSWDEYSSFVDICMAKKEAVICLSSALQYYNLSSINPGMTSVAVPHNTAKFVLDYPPITTYYFSDIIYPIEIEHKQTKQGYFNIYSLEKTICDVFLYRNKVGEDIVLESLKNYFQQKEVNLPKLYNVAKQFNNNILRVMEPYIRAMVTSR
jgi:predicted transcriptional regulator of viral defense system